MDANVKIVLDEYFEGADELKPNMFVLVRGDRVVDPLINAFFSETEAFTLIAGDDQEIFFGDILVYPKTRQFCHVEDIRHIPGKNLYVISYSTDVYED
ncbi:MAG: hypothetical protein SR2Q5_01520 [Quinella sp. 2Q5]|nr:hypothetical protein [Quinella sp. 2Q5]